VPIKKQTPFNNQYLQKTMVKLGVIPVTLRQAFRASFAGAGVLHRLRKVLLIPVTPHGATASVAGSSFVIDGKTFRQQSEDSCRQKNESLFVSTGCRWSPTHLHTRRSIDSSRVYLRGRSPRMTVIFLRMQVCRRPPALNKRML